MKRIDLENKSILITGCAGFIGSNLAIKLMNVLRDTNIIGIDNKNSYYDISLKDYRLRLIEENSKNKNRNKWTFIECDISDVTSVKNIFETYHPSLVVNLAAQAGVRYSIENPDSYIKSNIIGFYNILEACRANCENENAVEHLLYASSSSVYGGNHKIPFSEDDFVDNPVSLYAATKKSNELLAYSYSKLYNIPCTGLRFFTVYGPAGRPDMAYFLFTEKLLKNQNIQIFNYGNCKRDFTYIDDITEGLMRIMGGAPKQMTGSDGLPVAPHIIYNIGNSSPESLMDFIKILSEELVYAGLLPESFDLATHEILMPMQPGDVPVTYADISKLERDFDFKPSTDLRSGLKKFVHWYKEYYCL